MKTLIIIGNGESRSGIDFNTMPDHKIGCNATYRDHYVDLLVAVDHRIVSEALENDFHKLIYTRENWANSFYQYPNVKILPPLPYKGNKREDNAWHWGTGPHACNLAASMNPTEIHLYGFDLWGNETKINNIYKGSKNYDPIDHHAIDPRYWIYQLAKCFELYPNIKWIQHQPSDWRKPEDWYYSNLILAPVTN